MSNYLSKKVQKTNVSLTKMNKRNIKLLSFCMLLGDLITATLVNGKKLLNYLRHSLFGSNFKFHNSLLNTATLPSVIYIAFHS